MITKSSRRGFTLVELLVVIAIIGILIGILLPAIQLAREAGRKTACKSNLSQLGRAILLFDEQKGVLPKSHRRPADATGDLSASSCGWSWAFLITPYMERRDIYSSINISESDHNPDQVSQPKVKAVAAASVPILSCPSFSSSRWVEFVAPGSRPEIVDETASLKAMVANYKCLVASTKESHDCAYGGLSSSVTYGIDHPDGAIQPETTYPIDALSDGTSNTILIGESSERACSRWLWGKEMEMIGIPDSARPTQQDTTRASYYFPTGFKPEDPQWYDETDIDPGTDSSGLPFPSWKYTGRATAPSYENKQTNNTNAWLGPSSDHPDVVNHLYGDGSTHSISKTIDAAAYYFMITRSNNDPAPPKK